jgi:hypothetical protein
VAKGKKKTRATSPKPVQRRSEKSSDGFVDQFLAGKIVGMSDEDAIALAVFLDDEQ